MSETNRPDPDALLGRLIKTEEKKQHGRLKIFFGSSAGVGKTYAMLEAAHEHQAQNLDVLVGIVETHKRTETTKLLEGLTILPPLKIKYRGLTLEELDLDEALKRRPDIILVDELAHSNAPGTRHPKRWNDVIELLGMGIDVYTTLNVQHIESLSDVIASSTGVWVKETIPDNVFDLAEDVVLVDIDEDDLIQRLHEGKVYLAPGAMTRAAENFFKKSNLGALREIALRRTADRVDARRSEENDQDEHKIVSDKILVCIAADTMALTLARTGKRLATSLKAPWEALHIEQPSLTNPNNKSHKFISQTERSIEHMGGKLTTIASHDIVDEIINFARSNRFTKIVIGKDPGNSLHSIMSLFLVNRLIRKSGLIDVYIVTADNKPLPQDQNQKVCLGCWKQHLLTALLAGLMTLPSLVSQGVFTPTDQALLYIIGVVIVADRFGFISSLLYILLAAGAFQCFVLAPHYSFSIDNASYVISLSLMLMTSYIIATQATRLRAQTTVARDQQKQTHDLLSLTRTLTSANGRFPLAKLVADHIKNTLGGETTVWMINIEGHPSVILGDIPQDTYYKDFGALIWCLENDQIAGHGTETLPSAQGTYLPLTTDQGVIGVLGYFPVDKDAPISRAGLEALDTITHLLAAALMRVKAGEINSTQDLHKTQKDLQTAFLNSADEQIHNKNEQNNDLNMPSATITPHIIEEIQSALDKSNGNIQPSIDHERIKKERDLPSQQMDTRPISVSDLVERARNKIEERNKPLHLDIDIPTNLPDVLVDAEMMIQSLQTFLEHAYENLFEDLKVQIIAAREDDNICLDIILPTCSLLRHEQNKKQSILDDFTAESHARQDEVKMNVAISVIELHGGKAGKQETANGAVSYFITLPIA